MSDEPKTTNDVWTMPEPIFRSSEGRTPKSRENYIDPDEVDTMSPDFFEADTDENDIGNSEPEMAGGVAPETVPDGGPINPTEVSVQSIREKPQKNAGGCGKSVLMLLGIAGAVGLGTLAVVIYYLFFYTPQTTVF